MRLRMNTDKSESRVYPPFSTPFPEIFQRKTRKKIDFWMNGDYICYLLALGPVRGLSLFIDFEGNFGAGFRIGNLSRMDITPSFLSGIP